MKFDTLYRQGKSVTIYFAATLIPMLLMVIVNPFVAMNMSPQDYAISGYYNSFVPLITPLIIFYMLHYYTKRYYEVSEAERLALKAMLFKALMAFSFIVAALCMGALVLYILVFKKDIEFPLFPYIALSVFAIPLTGIYRLEQTEFRMSRDAWGYFRLTVAAGTILVLTNLLFVVIVKLGALGKLLAPLIANLAVFVWLLVRHRELFKVRSSFAEFKTVLVFCLPLALGAMLGYFSNGYDRTYLEHLGNVTEYGNYIVGAQIAGYLTFFSTAVTSTFQPDIYEAIAKKNRRGFAMTCLMQLGMIALVVVVFIALCPLIIRLLTAGRYVDASPYASIISISVFTSAVYYVINNYTIAKGYPRLYLYTTIIASVLTVLAYPPMVSAFGYRGGAYMTGISFILLALVNLFLLAFLPLLRKIRQ